MINKRQIGNQYEEMAVKYLEEKGYIILDRNYHAGRFAELDIIAKAQDGTTVFVECKYRKDTRYGSPLEAVTVTKQRNICKAALYYCNSHQRILKGRIRFDVIGITGDEIVHIENAFEFLS